MASTACGSFFIGGSEDAAPEWWSVCFYLPRRFHASNILADSGCVRTQNSHNRRVVPFLDIPPLRLGPLSIQPFGLLVCLGAIVGLFVAKWRARQVGLDVKIVRDLVRLCCVFGLFQGRISCICSPIIPRSLWPVLG